jgi:hypothetical protein
MKCNKYWFLLLGFMSTFTSEMVFAQQSPWQLSSGFDYSKGDYGGDSIETSISAIPLILTFTGDLLKFDASFSQLEIEGAGTVIPGDGLVRGQAQRVDDPVVTTESGVGDIWLSASRIIEFIPPELFNLDLAAKVKIPTADENKGLGTGATDYTLQAEIYKLMGGAMPFLTVAYKVRGEFEDFNIDDVLAVSIGSDFTLSEDTHVGLALDYQEASYADGDDFRELFAYLNQQLNRQWSLMLYGYKGLSDGSPDFGLGFQFSYKF